MDVFVTIFPAICSCGRQLGSLQYDIEDEINTTGATLNTVMNRRGLTKMCCRRGMVCAPTHIITSADTAAYTDEAGLSRPTGVGVQIPVRIVAGPAPTSLPYPTVPIFGETTPVVAATKVVLPVL